MVEYAGMAELADARDLKSREILSRTGSTPASGTNNIAEWSSLAARRAHNPKVMRFKSHLRNQKNSEHQLVYRVFSFLFAKLALSSITFEVMNPRSQSDQMASNLRASKND